MIGLINALAIFTICPLVVVALSGPILGEKLSWQRWAAVGIGMAGVLIILRPGFGVFSWPALLPIGSAVLFGTYSVLTRLTTRDEPSLPHWQAITPQDWGFVACYAATSILSNWLLQKCYETAEASAVQPFAYLHIVFASMIGITVFGETLAVPVILGTALIIVAGIWALWNEKTPMEAPHD